MALFDDTILNLIFDPTYMDIETSSRLEPVCSQFQLFALKVQQKLKFINLNPLLKTCLDDAKILRKIHENCPNLTKIKGVDLKKDELKNLCWAGNMVHLTELRLSSFELCPETFGWLQNFPKLDTMFIGWLDVVDTESDFDKFYVSPENNKLGLKHLTLNNCADKFLALCQLEKLVSLEISLSNVGDDDELRRIYQKLAGCIRLHDLTIITSLQPEFLQPMFHAVDIVPNLVNFSLQGMCHLLNHLVSVTSSCDRLAETLTKVAINVFNNLNPKNGRVLGKLKNLRHLIGHISNVDPTEVFETFSGLQTLVLNDSGSYRSRGTSVQFQVRMAATRWLCQCPKPV